MGLTKMKWKLSSGFARPPRKEALLHRAISVVCMPVPEVSNRTARRQSNGTERQLRQESLLSKTTLPGCWPLPPTPAFEMEALPCNSHKRPSPRPNGAMPLSLIPWQPPTPRQAILKKQQLSRPRLSRWGAIRTLDRTTPPDSNFTRPRPRIDNPESDGFFMISRSHTPERCNCPPDPIRRMTAG